MEVKDFLAGKLSEQDLLRMSRLTINWTVNPFEYYPESDTIETSEDWAWSHSDLTDDDLELLMRVCEMLSSASSDVSIPIHNQVDSQKMTREFTFAAGCKALDLDVAERFCRLLEQYPGYEVSIEEYAGGKTVKVSFWYRSELEYAKQNEDIKMLLEAAQAVKGAGKLRVHWL